MDLMCFYSWQLVIVEYFSVRAYLCASHDQVDGSSMVIFSFFFFPE
jgi:hypothetical protein